MNILLTGANGFIGKEFIKVFCQNRSDKDVLLAVSNEPMELSDGIITINHNNHRLLKELIEGYNIDILIHLGGGVPTNSKNCFFADDLKYLDNISSTVDLLNVLDTKPGIIIFASSVMVYNDTHDVISEISDTKPSHPYGMSKLFIERMLSDWAKENNVLLQILRIGQVYGAGEESNLVIPTFIDKAIRNELIQIYTKGTEKRSFIHVSDVAEMIWKAIFLKTSNIINVAGEKNISIKELAYLIAQIEGKEELVSILNQNINTRDFIYDCDLMHRLLAHEKMDFYKGLEEEYNFRKRKINMNDGSI